MKSILTPLLMIAFVFGMVFLMEKSIEEKEALQEQSTVIDENSVIYSDIGLEERLPHKVVNSSNSQEVTQEDPIEVEEPTENEPN